MQAQNGAGVPPRPGPPREVVNVPRRESRGRAPTQPLPALVAVPLNFIGFSFGLIARMVGFGGMVLQVIARRVLPRPVLRLITNSVSVLNRGTHRVDGTTAATDFIRNFSTRYGERCPRWQISGWAAATARAQSQGEFLFVYLHSPQHQDTDDFCKNTLCAPAFVDYVNSTFVSWGGDIRYLDAFKLASSLRACCYPYCALLAFSGPNTRLITCVEGNIRPDALAEILQRALVEHNGLLWEERILQEQRAMDRRLREEQDAEYQRSLEADRAREQERQRLEEEEERRRKEQEERQRMEELQRVEEERARQETERAIEQRRHEKQSMLEEEPPSSSDNVTIIRVRFPSGETHQRRFYFGSQLKKVLDWVEALECNSFLNFSLATTFPRKVFAPEDHESSLEELEFGKQTALVVQPEEQ